MSETTSASKNTSKTTAALEKTQRALEKITPLAKPLARTLGKVLFWILLSVTWLGVFMAWKLGLEPITIGIVCLIALLPGFLIYQYYAALQGLIELPERLRTTAESVMETGKQGVQNFKRPKKTQEGDTVKSSSTLNVFAHLSTIWALKSQLDEVREFVSEYVSFAVLMNPVVLMFLAMALFSSLALWLSVFVTVVISFFI